MDKFLQQLNENQKSAVLYNEGPSLVIAGAGSGKTRVLTYKIAYLLKNGISPYNILALTFTNKAAREMKERIAQVVGEETASLLWMGTFHSIFLRILRRESDKLGYSSNFTIYDSQDSRNLIKAIIKEKGLDDKIYKPAAIQSRISKAKNALITPQDYENNRELRDLDYHSKQGQIYEIYHTYWNRCKTSGVMDFDDLLLFTHTLFEEHPEVIERYRNQFRFILVDEYQDTNAVQHEIVSQLAADHHRVCVVGDDAQSIYSFRGANIGNILNFRNTYPECKLFKLEQNYRSTKTIVKAANSLIDKNKEQIPKTVYSDNKEGEKIHIISAYSDYEEGYNVASRIAEMRMLHRYEYQDFAILYRTNAQSRIFEEALRKINIPYKIYGGLSFYQRKEIKDVIAYMRVILNPNDEEALKRIINYPARGIGETTVKKIIAAANLHQVGIWEILSKPVEYNLNINSGTAKKLAGFCEIITQFMHDNETMNAHELGNEIIRKTGLGNELYTDKTPEGLSRVQNIEELTNSLYEFVSTRLEEGIINIKLSDFLSEVALLTDQDHSKDEDENRITMMTIHAAKGLEFKNVFIVGLEEDLFPAQQKNDKPQELEEERRLLYVAITRAEENVILTYAKSRFRNGQSLICSPSRFLRDIDKQYLRMPTELAFRKIESKIPIFETKNQQTYSPKPKINTSVNTYTNPRKLSKLTHTNSSESTHQSIDGLNVGARIKHERFGMGIVTELIGENENAKASVDFESFGHKQLLLKFAKFTVIE